MTGDLKTSILHAVRVARRHPVIASITGFGVLGIIGALGDLQFALAGADAILKWWLGEHYTFTDVVDSVAFRMGCIAAAVCGFVWLGRSARRDAVAETDNRTRAARDIADQFRESFEFSNTVSAFMAMHLRATSIEKAMVELREGFRVYRNIVKGWGRDDEKPTMQGVASTSDWQIHRLDVVFTKAQAVILGKEIADMARPERVDLPICLDKMPAGAVGSAWQKYHAADNRTFIAAHSRNVALVEKQMIEMEKIVELSKGQLASLQMTVWQRASDHL